ncbi:MAG: hypothetical protein JSW45_04310 [Thiotrichales bacterium]|nr:MAG: hypothetical protein JSW45_04310 [Thiotrichales bacterium]
MTPITIEFSLTADDRQFKEDTVALRNPQELFEYVSPGGGCESMPDDVDEIQLVFLSPEHPNQQNPVADIRGTLQLGIVFLTGPLAEILQTAEEIIDKAGRGELSSSFLTVIGANG